MAYSSKEISTLSLSRLGIFIVKGSAWLSGAAIAVVMVAIVTEIILRKIFHSAIPGLVEIIDNLMVLIVYLAIAYTYVKNRHVKVTIVLDRLSLNSQRRLKIIASIFSLLFFGLVFWQAGARSLHSITISEYSMGLLPFPTWPFKLMIPFGAFLIFVCMALDVLQTLKNQGDN